MKTAYHFLLLFLPCSLFCQPTFPIVSSINSELKLPEINQLDGAEFMAPCDVVEDIACGSIITRTTKDGGNDFNTYNGITGTYAGPDRLFRLNNLPPKTNIRVVLEILDINTNLDLFVFTSCSSVPTPSLSSTENNATSGILREVIDLNTNNATSIFILVDSKFGQDQIRFQLRVNCTCACSEPLAAQPTADKMWADDFGDYQNNIYLAPQSTRWRPWSADQTISGDAIVQTENSNKIVFFNGAQKPKPDLIYHSSDRTTGRYRFSWQMRVSNGKAGYFNMLHRLPKTNGDSAVWAYEVYFYKDGTGKVLHNNGINSASDTVARFAYPQARWLNVVNIVDIEQDLVELWVGEYYVGSWKFSVSSPRGSPYNRQLAGINFYAPTDHVFYVDNLCIWQKKSTCLAPAILDPTWTDKGTSYNSPGQAACELYTLAELESNADVCDFGGAFIDRGEIYAGELTAKDQAPNALKRQTGTCNAVSNGPALYADIYTFFNEQKQTNGSPEVVTLYYKSSTPALRCNVFMCRDPKTCAPLSDPLCIASIPPNTNVTINQSGFLNTCEPFYYIVFSGPLGAKYSNFTISPNGYCTGGAETIVVQATEQTYTSTLPAGTGASRFSSGSQGLAYKSCYSGNRTYNGKEKVYKVIVEERAFDHFGGPTTVGFSLQSNALVGMFLYSSICGGTCLDYAENTNGVATMGNNFQPGVYYLVIDRNSTIGNVTFNLVAKINFGILVLDECNEPGSAEAHQVTIQPSACAFQKDDEVVFLNTKGGKLREIAAQGWSNFDQPMSIGMTDKPAVPALTTFCANYQPGTPFQIYWAQRSGGVRLFRKMNATYTPRNTNGNTAEGVFEKGKRSNVELMRISETMNFGSETNVVSLAVGQSESRLLLSTNKAWKVDIMGSPFGNQVEPNPWLTVTPNTFQSGNPVKIRATSANTANISRTLYLVFYAVDNPDLLRHVVAVTQGTVPSFSRPPEGTASTALEGVQWSTAPNPTTGRATLQLDLPNESAVEVRLFDMAGHLLEVALPLQNTFSTTLEMDLSHYPNGLYHLVATVDGRPLHQTIAVGR